MPKYVVDKTLISNFQVVIEAKDTDEVYDILAEGVEWEFLQSDDDFVVYLKEEK